MHNRFDNLTELEAPAKLLADGHDVCVQFSGPGYTRPLLEELDVLAQNYGERLQVRFYGHYGSSFDFKSLSCLSHVGNLAIDCLMRAENFDVLGEMKFLRQLSIGVYFDLPENLLRYDSLKGLKSLVLSESKSNKLDLAPLVNFSALEKLHITGFTKNLDCVGDLLWLRKLSLSQIGKQASLNFVSRMAKLQFMRIILGGREDLGEIINASVEHIEVVRVRGLAEFRPSNFLGMKHLLIEDQIRLKDVSFSEANSAIQSIRFINCKILSSLRNLRMLGALKFIGLFQTEIDLDKLIESGLPVGLESFTFHGKRRADDVKARAKLDNLGYSQRYGPVAENDGNGWRGP